LPNDKTLIFESRFESGNLRKAMKVGPFEYELYLKNDYPMIVAYEIASLGRIRYVLSQKDTKN
jgi:predicted AAA+ superfamily ATPase